MALQFWERREREASAARRQDDLSRDRLDSVGRDLDERSDAAGLAGLPPELARWAESLGAEPHSVAEAWRIASQPAEVVAVAGTYVGSTPLVDGAGKLVVAIPNPGDAEGQVIGRGSVETGGRGGSAGQQGRAVMFDPDISPDVSYGRPLRPEEKESDPYTVATNKTASSDSSGKVEQVDPDRLAPNSAAALEADQRAAEASRQQRNMAFMLELLAVQALKARPQAAEPAAANGRHIPQVDREVG